jgi:hypothetical protein
LNLEAYSGCTYLIAWGWNYTSGGKVDLKFYDDSAATDSTQATAASSGYLNGYVQWDIPNTGYHTYHKYWVSAYDEASGWSVSSNYVQC